MTYDVIMSFLCSPSLSNFIIQEATTFSVHVNGGEADFLRSRHWAKSSVCVTCSVCMSE